MQATSYKGATFCPRGKNKLSHLKDFADRLKVRWEKTSLFELHNLGAKLWFYIISCPENQTARFFSFFQPDFEGISCTRWCVWLAWIQPECSGGTALSPRDGKNLPSWHATRQTVPSLIYSNSRFATLRNRHDLHSLWICIQGGVVGTVRHEWAIGLSRHTPQHFEPRPTEFSPSPVKGATDARVVNLESDGTRGWHGNLRAIVRLFFDTWNAWDVRGVCLPRSSLRAFPGQSHSLHLSAPGSSSNHEWFMAFFEWKYPGAAV